MGTERTVSSGGQRLAVRDHGGDGPELLLIHGAGMNLEAWGPLIDQLGDEYRIVTYDLPGHGESQGDEAATWESSLASVGALIEALSLRSPVLVGHSLGGMLGLVHLRAGGVGRGLIDVDGWVGPPLPNRFTSEALSRIQTQLTAMAVASREGLDNLIALQRSVGPVDGEDLDATEAVLRRSYPFGDDDKALRRPSPEETIAIMGSLSELDMRVKAEGLGVPALFVLATQFQAGAGLTEDEFLSDRLALSEWLEAAGWPIERVDCSHLVPLLRPKELASMITSFVSQLVR